MALSATLDASRSLNEQLIAEIEDVLRGAWSDVSWFDSPAQARFAAQVAPLMEGAQATAAQVTAAALAQLETEALGAAQPVGVPADQVSTMTMRGVSGTELWGRPFQTVWTALSNGDAFSKASTNGLARALELARTNLQLAHTHAGRHVMRERPTIQGYRRVVGGRTPCALCVLASSQRYHKSALMPIHPGCNCSVLPIFGAVDPGRVIDSDARDAAYRAVAEVTNTSGHGYTAADYKKIVIVHEHGEIGPVLAKRGQAFTGPAQIS